MVISFDHGTSGAAVECFTGSVCHRDICFVRAFRMGSFSARNLRRRQRLDEIRIRVDGARFGLFWFEAGTAPSYAQPARRSADRLRASANPAGTAESAQTQARNDRPPTRIRTNRFRTDTRTHRHRDGDRRPDRSADRAIRGRREHLRRQRHDPRLPRHRSGRAVQPRPDPEKLFEPLADRAL